MKTVNQKSITLVENWTFGGSFIFFKQESCVYSAGQNHHQHSSCDFFVLSPLVWVSALNWIINLITLATKILRVCTIYYTPKWWYPPSNLRPTPLGTENVKVQAFLFKRLKPEIILIVAQNHDQTLLATFCLFTIPCVEWCLNWSSGMLAKSFNFFAKKINVLFSA